MSERPTGLPICKPPGNASVKLTLVAGAVFELLIVIVMVVVPPNVTVGEPNDLLTPGACGGFTSTVMLAQAGPPEPPFRVLTVTQFWDTVVGTLLSTT